MALATGQETEDLIGRRIVVVDDEAHVRQTLRIMLESEGYVLELFESAEAFFERLPKGGIDLALLDVRMPGLDGLSSLQKLRDQGRDLPVIMMSGNATLAEAVRAMSLGAIDFLEKPLSQERTLITVRNAIERRALSARVEALEATYEEPSEMLGQSAAIQTIRQQISQIGPTKVRVLITGESGTGKELIARAIHRESPRRLGPFVKVNCAAIPAELIESELFGHERGAFSGAVQKRRGRFELADRGTLFLDEIGDMSLEAQAKVLRVLQTGEVMRVGSEKTFCVDVRILAATNKNLEAEVQQGRFREDLYFRLAVVPIVSPPLRERGDDIGLLMDRYLEHFSREYAKNPTVQMSPEARAQILRYSFPGNVRELCNLAERLVLLASNPVRREELPAAIQNADAIPNTTTADTRQEVLDLNSLGELSLKDFKELAERQFVWRKLERNAWNITQTAAELDVERSHLHKKLRQWGLERP